MEQVGFIANELQIIALVHITYTFEELVFFPGFFPGFTGHPFVFTAET